MAKIAASLLAAPPLCMQDSILQMQDIGVDMLHLDVMDGLFVPNFSFGMSVVEAARKVTRLPLDVHLMIVEPERYLEAFAQAGADRLSVHLEACADPAATLARIRSLGMAPGLTIKPQTPVEALAPYLGLVDNILVMTVEPGFGGQSLLPSCAQKIKPLRSMMDQTNPKATITVDGGIHAQNAGGLAKDGADVLVMGTALVRAKDPALVLAQLALAP